MTQQEFELLVLHAGMDVPEGIAEYLADLAPRGDDPLLSDGFLEECARRGGLQEPGLQRLREALSAIRADQKLLRLSCVLRDDVHRALIHQRACGFTRPEPACLNGFSREAYALLFALSCLEQGLGALERRGIMRERYEAVCRRMADKQMDKLQRTGSALIEDYPWDMNFYGCAIFLCDRFYFIPYKWEGPCVYRRTNDGKVLALWPAGSRVRRDGQLDGVNGVKDPMAFETAWEEDEQSVTACPVNPAGRIRPSTVTLPKSEWKPALTPGDMTLAVHIPGGEGYTPQRWKSSMEEAKAFFDRWFPEIPTKGFWSESWLYDPTLSRLLPEEGRIMSVQRQFYIYPTMEGEEMIKLEVFGDAHADLDAVEVKTSLQQKLLDSLRRGEHYHTSGMFVLHVDLRRFGSRPYQTDEDIADCLKG